MGDCCYEWRARSKELEAALKGGEAPASRVTELLKVINGFAYPVVGLTAKDAEGVLCNVLQCNAAHSGESIPELALLVSSLLSQQQLSLLPITQDTLLSLFLAWLPRVHPPTELLYTSATLTQAGAAPKNVEVLLSAGSVLLKLAFGGHCPIETQRAALHYVTTLCTRDDLPQPILQSLLESLLHQLLTPAPSSADTVLQAKLMLSLLRLVHTVLLHLSSLRAYPSLATLLALLKANMAIGLPGQPKTLASIQPPLSIPPCQLTPRSPSVAGPHQRKRHRGRGRERGRPREQSSDPSPPPSIRSWHATVSSYSSSDSELSDSEPAPNRVKAVYGRVRHQAHSCLAAIFHSLDRHTAFSYWLSFLPDGPRPPNSTPSLLTCLLKDPMPKCRGAAVSVLCAMLEGSKPYLAATDDKPLPSQPFTPYSSTLGAVVRELHRTLTLAVAAESHPTTLARIIKCLSLLVTNTPYHQLSEGYLTRVASTLLPCASHRDTDVHVACLTCYGAVVSISPALPEVQRWLGEREGGPWLVEHCTTLLKGGAPLALQTEALQVLAAVPKFYFQAIGPHWSQLGELYLTHLAHAPDPLQQHALRMLEELCRALPPSLEVTQLWETLLLAGGPLSSHLQQPSCGPSCAQACNVLATVGNDTLEQIKTPARLLALSLPLGLSQDETASTTVTASAVRVLGVFVLYKCLREDTSFLLDCRASLLHSVHSPSLLVRTQASWALGNLTDTLPSLPLPLLPPLYAAICEAMKDNEKVKCNAVRAAGNLLKMLQEPVATNCREDVERLTVQLAKCVNSGTMKSRWNACYAAHSALTNTVFTTHCPTPSQELISVLCVAVQTCKNFKVRSNAALALGSPEHYRGGDQFVAVWRAVVQGLENSEQQGDFSEFKHAATLKAQLCSALCHMCAVMTVEQVQALSPLSLPPTLTRNIAEFTLTPQKEEEGDTKTRVDVVEPALRTLNSLAQTAGGGGGGGDVARQLLDMFQGSSHKT